MCSTHFLAHDNFSILHGFPKSSLLGLISALHGVKSRDHCLLRFKSGFGIPAANPPVIIWGKYHQILFEVCSGLIQRVVAIGAAPGFIGMWVVLAVVMPATEDADILPSTPGKSGVAAARARVSHIWLCCLPGAARDVAIFAMKRAAWLTVNVFFFETTNNIPCTSS
jgi:hypothetical protein